jgi:hypothetical protein
MKEEINYIPFPLPMIRRFFTDPKNVAADIIDYGIYRAAMGIRISAPESPYRQLTYEFIRQGLQMPHGDSYRVPESISYKLIEMMNKEYYLETLDYGGFSSESDFTEFDCSDDIVLLMYAAENDENFRNEVDEWYRLRQVQNVVGVSFSVSEHQQIKETYQRIESGFKGEPQVPVSCKTSILQDRQDAPGTERERAKLCLYLGIRSLIGRAEIAVTTSKAIKSRMFGARNEEELQSVLKDKKLAGLYKQYCTRYQYDNLLYELRAAGMVNKLSFGRNTIVTCSLQDDDEFREAIAKRLNSANDAENRHRLKEREKANREKLKAMLGSNDVSLEIQFADMVNN